MKITAIDIKNVKGFQRIKKTEFSDSINILIGPNNAGKSTILNSIFQLQREILSKNDITLGRTEGIIELYFKGEHPSVHNDNDKFDRFILTLHDNNRRYGRKNYINRTHGLNIFSEREPRNLI